MGERSIMIVEDEPRLLHSLTFTLRRRNYAVQAACHAEQALELLSRQSDAQRCELIITDLQLPGMSGVEFIDQVRQTRPGTRIVVMTAFPGKTVQDQLRLRGIEDFLSKPFDIQALLLKVEAAFDTTSQHSRGNP